MSIFLDALVEASDHASDLYEDIKANYPTKQKEDCEKEIEEIEAQMGTYSRVGYYFHFVGTSGFREISPEIA